MKNRYAVWRMVVLAGVMGLLAVAEAQEAPGTPEDVLICRDLPLVGKGELQFFVETAAFRGPEGFTLLEVYTVLDARQLQFVPEDSLYVAQIDLSLTVKDSLGNLVKTETWTRNVSVTDIRQLRETGAIVRDMVGFGLVPGAYEILCSIEDIYGDKMGTGTGGVRVRDFEQETMVASDILFATQIEQSETPGQFVRNRWKVIPNATRRYLAGKPIHVYFEIYHLKTNPERPQDSFVLGYSLKDTSGVLVKSYPAHRLIKPGESVVKTEILDTEGIPGGVYTLQVEAFDRSTREHLRLSRKVMLVSDEPEELSEEEQDRIRFYKDIRYVASESDRNLYAKLTTHDSQMNFLRQYWKKMDPTPGTPMNERLRDHMMRMQHAENNFTSQPNRRGSDTDMGRVYIKYGPPDEHDFTTSAAGGKAIDTWIYERSGRYLFVFQDRRGHGVFELVHSTMSGEIYNPDWQDSRF